MKKWKDKITTRRLVIAFVIISLVVIFGFSLKNTSTKQTKKVETVEVTKKENQKQDLKKEEPEQQVQEPKEDKQEEPTETKKETKTETTQNQSTSQQTQTENKKNEEKPVAQQQTQPSQNPTTQQKQEETKPQPQEKVSTVHIIVSGKGSTFSNRDVEISEGMTVYDVLKKSGVSLQTSGYGSTIYIKGINGLKEFDYGPRSGWVYSVNGVSPNYGCASYKVKDGDSIQWSYTEG